MTEQVTTIITEEPPKVESVSADQKLAETLYPPEKVVAEEKPADVVIPPIEEKVPEEIKYELKLPENSLLDPARLTELADYAKSKSLSPEVAQEILNRESSTVATFIQNQQEQNKQETTKWFNDSKNDKEMGGANFKESSEFAKRTIERFGTPELKKILNESRLGDHPEALRVFARIGRELFKNDELVHAGASSKNTTSMEDMFYPTNKGN